MEECIERLCAYAQIQYVIGTERVIVGCNNSVNRETDKRVCIATMHFGPDSLAHVVPEWMFSCRYWLPNDASEK